MKTPFSYRKNFFKSVLAVSVFSHGIIFAQGDFFSPAPKYEVENAPSSMEVMIVEEPEIKEKEVLKQEKVLTVREVSPELPAVTQKEPEKKDPPKKIEKSVNIPPVRGAVTEARPDYFKNPAPRYPFLARQRGWQGVVLLKVKVAKNGHPVKVLVAKSSGHQILDEAAVKTVEKWRFSPSRAGNITFASWVRIPVRFLLENE